MKSWEINPHIRFAESMQYKTGPITVNVYDSRIFCVLDGELELVIENQHYILTKNTLFYCCGGSIYTISSKNGCSLLVLNFDPEQSRSKTVNCCSPVKYTEGKQIFKNAFYIDDCEFMNSHIAIDDNMRFYNTVQNIITEFSEKKIYFREKSSAMLKELLIDIYRAELKKSENSSEAVEKAVMYIKSNYSEKISNKDIASVAGYHEYHLNRLFIKHTGMTMHRYILETRLEEAKNMLINSEMKIYQISEKCGFSSTAHFTSYFSKNFGYSPSKYKEDIRNKI